MTDIIIRPNQTYAHKNHTRYYEITSIFQGFVDFRYYDSQKDKTFFETRPIIEFEQMIRNGTLIRDC